MKQKGLATAVIVGIVVAVVAVVGVAAVLVIAPGLPGGDGDGDGVDGVTIASMDFSFTGYQLGGLAGTIRVRARNLQTDPFNPDYRVEITGEGMTEGTVIYNSADAALYIYSASEDIWYKYTGTLLDVAASAYQGFVVTGYAWIQAHGTANFTIDYAGVTINVTNITVNPTLGDDVFSPPAGATIQDISY